MSTAKDEILDRIRRAIRGPSAPPASYQSAIQREYTIKGSLSPHDCIALFIDRLHDYGAVVYRADSGGIAGAIAQAMRERGKQTLLIPPGLPQDWLPSLHSFVTDTDLAHAEIDRSEGVLTGCALAIAISGTIILRHSPAEGRRALTLIPDYHLCVVFEDQVVETVAQALDQLNNFAAVPITTVSGPSATSDIEMTRIKGVHGPRVLDVILVAR